MGGIIDMVDFLARTADKSRGSELAEFIGASEGSLVPTFTKLPQEEEDRSLVASLFGIPLGFQFGTALGMDGLPAFVVDVLTDPLTYLSVGTLTAAGRAGRVVRSLQRGSAKARKLDTRLLRTADDLADIDPKLLGMVDELSKVSGMTGEKAAQAIGQHMKVASRLEIKSIHELMKAIKGVPDNEVITVLRDIRAGKKGAKLKFAAGEFVPNTRTLDLAINAARTGGTEGAEVWLKKEASRRLTLRQKALQLAKAGDKHAYNKVAKEILKLKPSRRWEIALGREARRDMGALFDLSKHGKKIKPTARTAGEQAAFRVDGMAAPQRSLVKFRIPFTNMEKSVVTGAGALKSASNFAERHKWLRTMGKSAGLVPGARTAARRAEILLKQPKRVAAADTVHDIAMMAAASIKADITPPEIAGLRAVHETHSAEKMIGKNKAWLLQKEFVDAMPDVKDRSLVMGLIQQQSKYLSKASQAGTKIFTSPAPGVTSVTATKKTVHKGTFGKTGVFGELTPEAIKAGVTDEHLLMAEAIDVANRFAGEALLSEGLLETLVHSYWPRMMKIVKGKADEFNKALADISSPKAIKQFYAHGLTRKIPFYDDLLELEKKGIVEIEKDAAVLLGEYYTTSAKIAADARVLRRVGAAKRPIPTAVKDVDERLAPIIIRGRKGSGELTPLAKTGLYQEVRDPEIVSFARQLGQQWRGINDAIWVHKDDVTSLKRMIKSGESMRGAPGEALTDKAFRAAININSGMKRSLLLGSAFHYMALTESAVADLGWTFLRNPMQAFRQGQREFFEATDIMDEAIRSGLQLGPMMDAEVDSFQRMLKWAGNSIPGLSKPARMLGNATMQWDRGLWEYYHSGLKMFAYHELYNRALTRFPNQTAKQISRGVAEHVNNAFGGQVWENLMVSKRGQQFARLMFLAPDWTLSNLRIAADVFANKFKKFEWYQKTSNWAGFPIRQEDILRSDVRAFFSRQYALRTGLIFGLMANMANFAFTGKFMSDNPEGHKSMVQMPWKDSKNRKLYMRFGKQFREPFELVNVFGDRSGPVETLRRKQSRIFSTVTTQVAGRDVFGNPIVTTEDGPLMNLAKRLGFVIGGNLPIPAQEMAGLGRRAAKHPLEAMPSAFGMPIKTEFIRKRNAPQPAAIPNAIGEAAADKTYSAEMQRRLAQVYEATDRSLLAVAR